MIRVLVVEDGFEYRDTLVRFLGEGFAVTRAGDGAEALGAVAAHDVVLLDMRFDRVSPGQLLGDLADTAERFNGDPVRARQFLEDNQGAYILAALRAAGHATPALFCHDFSGEPRRWAVLERKYAPVSWLPDNASPSLLRETIRAAATAS
ncbi:MAG: hypothetical protein FJ102_21255 [Deltaproteobacteria bacterium]|nr:hypothetical protein [Deltaproteobacteria bacterium]